MIVGEIVWKSFSSNPDYVVLTSSGLFKVIQEDSQSDFDVGELVQIVGVVKLNEVFCEGITLVETALEEVEARKIEEFLSSECKAFDFKLYAEDDVLLKLVEPTKNAALVVKKALMRCTPLIIRFHNDPDGVSSGLLFKKAVLDFVAEKNVFYQEKWVVGKQADSAIFEEKNAEGDVETAGNFCRPALLCLFDHGANVESEHALKTISMAGMGIVIVDHHPYSETAKRLSEAFVSAREFGGGAKHCGGLLSYHLSLAICGKSDQKIAEIAMEGDKSNFFTGNLKETLALDYAISREDDLLKYEKLLADPSTVEVFYRRAANAIKRAGEIALKNCEHVQAGRGRINVINVKPLRKLKYPPKGAALQEVHKHFEGKDYPVVTLGVDEERIIFRVNGFSKFKANETIGFIRNEFGEVTPSGGGHEKAASMRVKPGFCKPVLARVIDVTREFLEKE